MNKRSAVRCKGYFSRLRFHHQMLLARIFFKANPDFHLIDARDEAAHIHVLSYSPKQLMRLIAAMIYQRVRDDRDVSPARLDELLQKLEELAEKLEACRKSGGGKVRDMIELLDVPMQIERVFAELRCNRVIFMSCMDSTRDSRENIRYFNSVTGLTLRVWD